MPSKKNKKKKALALLASQAMAESVPAKTEPPKIDEDLLCLICTELVLEARHVSCCGGLYCKTCIDIWMSRASTNNQACPNCRAVLNRTNIITDYRSDRKSALQLRLCPFSKSHNCQFIGNRQEVDAHKAVCPCDPDLCTSKRCKTWEAERATEKAAWLVEKMKLEQEIQSLKRRIEVKESISGTTGTAIKKALAGAAFLCTPEAILKHAYAFDGVRVLTADVATKTKKYTIHTVKDGEQPTVQDIRIEIAEANYNFTLFCYRHKDVVVPADGLPPLKVVVTLVSFDETVSDKSQEVVLASDLALTQGFGFQNWTMSYKFEKVVKDGKFAIGWTVSTIPMEPKGL